MKRYKQTGVIAAVCWQRPGHKMVGKGDGKKPSPFCYAKEDRKEVIPKSKESNKTLQENDT